MTTVKFSEKAYCKMILHAAKYPHCSVNGVLLAKTSSLNSNKEIEFVDTIPLFHICINLTPMAEIALMQIDEYVSKNGLTIVGYYVSPENIRDNSFERVYSRIADKIAVNCSHAYVIIVTSTITSIQSGNVALKIGHYSDGNYKLCEKTVVSEDSINACINLLENNFYKKLVDFDNHLDNLYLDWTNSKFNKEIENLL